MSEKHIFYILLLSLSIFFVQCQNESTPKEAVTDISAKATQAKAQMVEATKVAKKATQEAVNDLKEATPTLTSIKEEVSDNSALLAEKKKEAELAAEKAAAAAKKEAKAKKEAAAKKKRAEKRKAAKKKAARKKRAKVKFENTSHQFGNIKQGEVIKHDFKFKNTGTAPLVIKKVDVSCGCTFPSYPFMPIEPGKEGTIGITYDSKNKVGRQKPTITVVTNGRPHTFKLHLEGIVE